MKVVVCNLSVRVLSVGFVVVVCVKNDFLRISIHLKSFLIPDFVVSKLNMISKLRFVFPTTLSFTSGLSRLRAWDVISVMFSFELVGLSNVGLHSKAKTSIFIHQQVLSQSLCSIHSATK